MPHHQTIDDVLSGARARVAEARRQAGASPWLVGYDVNGIQEYITANSRPIAMRGASLLIKDFDEEQQKGRGALFAGGGRGMWLVDRTEAKRLLKELPCAHAQRTVTSVLAVAAVPWSGRDVEASLRWLKLKLQGAKDAALPPRDARPASKAGQCQRCRAYEATAKLTFGAETEHVCERCKKITVQGRQGMEDDDQHGLSLTELSARGYVAAISADGNNMGQLFDELTTVEAVAGLSAAVAWLFAKAHKEALDAAKVTPREYVDPISGGDDIRVFLSPKHVEPYVRTLARGIEDGVSSFGDLGGMLNGAAVKLAHKIGVGVGVAVAGDKTSASWMLHRAHDLERSAKTKCLAGARSAVDFVWVSSGEAYLDGASKRRGPDKDQRPLSLDGDWSDYVRKTRALRAVPASQRAVVAERRAMGPEEFANLLRYQVARSEDWQAWYEHIGSDWHDPQRVLSDMPDTGMLDLLRMLEV